MLTQYQNLSSFLSEYGSLFEYSIDSDSALLIQPRYSYKGAVLNLRYLPMSGWEWAFPLPSGVADVDSLSELKIPATLYDFMKLYHS